MQKQSRLLGSACSAAAPSPRPPTSTPAARPATPNSTPSATAPDLLAAMAAVHQPRAAYADYAAMLADPQVEAVIVAMADQFHVPLAVQALRAGKHVLVEKPLGVDVAECERCGRGPGDGLALQVGHNKRFDPGIAFAHSSSRTRWASGWGSRPGTATRPTATP